MPAAVYTAIHAALKEAGVRLSASLPDDWVRPLVECLDADPEIRSLRVAREPEVIGVCAGAFLGGNRAVGVVGATGLLACVSEIATLSLRYGIPMVLVSSLRGQLRDLQVFQEVQGRVLLPVLGALQLPHLVVRSAADAGELPHAFEYARLQKRAFIVCIAKEAITASTGG